jgi:intracellular septation protein
MQPSQANAMSSARHHIASALKGVVVNMSGMLLFLAIVLITDDIFLATAVGIVVSVAGVVWQKVHYRPIDRMQWLSLGLIVVLGTVTLVTHDARFVQLKPTIVHVCIGAYMLRPGWSAPFLPEQFRTLIPRRLLVGWGYVWAAAMFALAGSFLLVAQHFDQRTWAAYVSIAPVVVIVVLSAVGIPLFISAARRAKRAASGAAD